MPNLYFAGKNRFYILLTCLCLFFVFLIMLIAASHSSDVAILPPSFLTGKSSSCQSCPMQVRQGWVDVPDFWVRTQFKITRQVACIHTCTAPQIGILSQSTDNFEVYKKSQHGNQSRIKYSLGTNYSGGSKTNCHKKEANLGKSTSLYDTWAKDNRWRLNLSLDRWQHGWGEQRKFPEGPTLRQGLYPGGSSEKPMRQILGKLRSSALSPAAAFAGVTEALATRWAVVARHVGWEVRDWLGEVGTHWVNALVDSLLTRIWEIVNGGREIGDWISGVLCMTIDS